MPKTYSTKLFSEGLVNPLEKIDFIKDKKINLFDEMNYLRYEIMYKEIRCYLCKNYKVKNQSTLNNHFKSKHTDEETTCDDCSATFLSTPLYYEHLIEKHILYPKDEDGIAINNCFVCSTPDKPSHFANYNNLNRHYNDHHYRIEESKAKAKDKPPYERKKQHHCPYSTDKKNPCDFKPTGYLRNFAEHLYKAHGEKIEGLELYECKICNTYGSYDKTKYNAHVAAHNKGSIYPKHCEITPEHCGVYENKKIYNSHLAHKHNKGSKLCSNCNEKFAMGYTHEGKKLCRTCFYEETGFHSSHEQQIAECLDALSSKAFLADRNTFAVKYDIPREYMPDKLYMKDDFIVFFECDEQSYPHAAYATEKERLDTVLPKLKDKKLVIVRYHPANISKPIRINIASKTVEKVINMKHSHKVSIYYLLYDKSSEHITNLYPNVFISEEDEIDEAFPSKSVKIKVKK